MYARRLITSWFIFVERKWFSNAYPRKSTGWVVVDTWEPKLHSVNESYGENREDTDKTEKKRECKIFELL